MTRSANGAAKPTEQPNKSNPRRGSRTKTKISKCLAQLQRRRGASIAELGKTTGWQPHSIRAALSGLRKRGHQIDRTKDDRGVTRYYVTAT